MKIMRITNMPPTSMLIIMAIMVRVPSQGVRVPSQRLGLLLMELNSMGIMVMPMLPMGIMDSMGIIGVTCRRHRCWKLLGLMSVW